MESSTPGAPCEDAPLPPQRVVVATGETLIITFAPITRIRHDFLRHGQFRLGVLTVCKIAFPPIPVI